MASLSSLFIFGGPYYASTASNYVSYNNMKKITTTGKTSFSPLFILPSPSSSSPSPSPSPSPLPSPSSSPSTLAPLPISTPSPQVLFFSPSSSWSSDLESTYSNNATSVSSINDSKKKEAIIRASTSSSNSLNVQECSASVTTPLLSPSE
ncbi:hypothetical protein X777_12275 [Ooceraea biroi]|uniref:Uncharacterized protein n=1 Tax=Ooceraea biroi TaxID=2015173 RepID=A0A026W1M4_OOCBI|nr:hypothetical protein X777_12275 [Ooceraea biroi]